MTVIAKPYTFSPNTSISSSQMNSNFDTLYNDYNGGISAANLASNAVTTAKIADSNVTTAKLNDDAVTTAKIADDTITGANINFAATGADAGIWWEELGRTTLGGTADSISVTPLSARKYLKVIASILNSGQLNVAVQFNGDTGSNYASTSSDDGGAGSSSTSQASLAVEASTTSSNEYVTFEILNITAQEKVGILHTSTVGTTGAGNAPSARTSAIKWANTAAQITRVDFINTGTGDFASGSEVVVLGHN